jgi:hypothetical protein
VGNVKEHIIVENAKTGKPSKKPIYYSYKDVLYDNNGWADSKKYLPEDFDLVHMRLEREKTVPGWVSGSSWFGLRFRSDDVVLCWKRMHEGDGS